jgi:hypothetical protein
VIETLKRLSQLKRSIFLITVIMGCLGVGLFFVINGGTTFPAGGSKETELMNGHIDEARLWLSTMPLQDNPRRISTIPEKPITWDEWVRKGKEITNIEESLLWLLENEEDSVTRASVALALGFVGGSHSVNPLIHILESDIPVVQMEAAASLGRLGQAEAIESLCSALKNSDVNVRANACMALGQIGEENGITCLKDALEDKDAFVRAAAKEAMQIHLKK